MAAPITAIVGTDMAFYGRLPKLFPHTDARSWFAGNDKLIAQTAFRKFDAARWLSDSPPPARPGHGRDVRIRQQDRHGVFFAGGAVKSNFLIKPDYGDASQLFPRSPHFSFDEAVWIV
jgi:3-hydroxypropanoate dehydrogenase